MKRYKILGLGILMILLVSLVLARVGPVEEPSQRVTEKINELQDKLNAIKPKIDALTEVVEEPVPEEVVEEEGGLWETTKDTAKRGAKSPYTWLVLALAMTYGGIRRYRKWKEKKTVDEMRKKAEEIDNSIKKIEKDTHDVLKLLKDEKRPQIIENRKTAMLLVECIKLAQSGILVHGDLTAFGRRGITFKKKNKHLRTVLERTLKIHDLDVGKLDLEKIIKKLYEINKKLTEHNDEIMRASAEVADKFRDALDTDIPDHVPGERDIRNPESEVLRQIADVRNKARAKVGELQQFFDTHASPILQRIIELLEEIRAIIIDQQGLEGNGMWLDQEMHSFKGFRGEIKRKLLYSLARSRAYGNNIYDMSTRIADSFSKDGNDEVSKYDELIKLLLKIRDELRNEYTAIMDAIGTHKNEMDKLAEKIPLILKLRRDLDEQDTQVPGLPAGAITFQKLSMVLNDAKEKGINLIELKPSLLRKNVYYDGFWFDLEVYSETQIKTCMRSFGNKRPLEWVIFGVNGVQDIVQKLDEFMKGKMDEVKADPSIYVRTEEIDLGRYRVLYEVNQKYVDERTKILLNGAEVGPKGEGFSDGKSEIKLEIKNNLGKVIVTKTHKVEEKPKGPDLKDEIGKIRLVGPEGDIKVLAARENVDVKATDALGVPKASQLIFNFRMVKTPGHEDEELKVNGLFFQLTRNNKIIAEESMYPKGWPIVVKKKSASISKVLCPNSIRTKILSEEGYALYVWAFMQDEEKICFTKHIQIDLKVVGGIKKNKLGSLNKEVKDSDRSSYKKFPKGWEHDPVVNCIILKRPPKPKKLSEEAHSSSEEVREPKPKEEAPAEESTEGESYIPKEET